MSLENPTPHSPSNEQNPVKKAFDEFEAIRKDRTSKSISQEAEAALRASHPEEAPFGPLTKEMSGLHDEYTVAEIKKVRAKIGQIIRELPSELRLSQYRAAGNDYIGEHAGDIKDAGERQAFSDRVIRYSELLGTASKKTPLEAPIENLLYEDTPPPKIGQTFYEAVDVGYKVAKGKLDPATGRYWVNFEDPRGLVGRKSERIISQKEIDSVTENEDGTTTVEFVHPYRYNKDRTGQSFTFDPADETFRVVEKETEDDKPGKRFLEHYIPAKRMSLSSAVGNSRTAQQIVRGMGLHPSEFGVHTSDVSETYRPVTDDHGNLTINPEPVDVAKRD